MPSSRRSSLSISLIAGRAYRDLLGWANQRLVQEVYFLVAGLPVHLKPPV